MHRIFLKAVGCITIIGFIGCANLRQDESWQEARPLGKELKAYKPPESTTFNSLEFEDPTGVIILSQALSLALMRNPELKAFSWEVRAKEAITLQAGLFPNPELGFKIEDFGGSGSVEGFKGTETTILLSQLILLAGKLSKRQRVASLNTDLAGWDYETTRLDVFTQTAQAFVDVLVAQERLSLIEELVQLAEQVYKTVSELVEAGKVSPIEETRARVALSQTQIRLDIVRRELEAARKILGAMWGSTQPIFKKVEGNLDVILQIPSFNQLVSLISQNPDIARWATEMEQRRADLALEKANAIPDLIISGGLRRLNEPDDNAFVIGVSIPIPIFNRNQGRVLEARYRLVKAEEEQKNANVQVYINLGVAYKTLSAAFAEVIALKNKVLPGAQSAYDAIFEGYRGGKFPFLDVLDSQRVLFENRFLYIEALASYHKAFAEVERLIGAPISATQ